MHYQLSKRHKEKRTTYLKILTSGEFASFREKVLSWLRSKDVFCWLDSFDYYHQNDWPYHTFDILIGVGEREKPEIDADNIWENLAGETQQKEWLLGYFGYDLKNGIENLTSGNPDLTGLPETYFFRPEILLFLKDDILTIESSDAAGVWEEINAQFPIAWNEHLPVFLKPRISKEEYIRGVDTIRQHITEGNVYELNYCQEFFAEGADINPFYLWYKAGIKFPQPFSAFLRIHDKYVVCASMERFLRKEGPILIAQPIKGTIRRGNTPDEDSILAESLRTNEKERAENIMIVDLVRNDLAKNCIPGTVQVKELCEIYTFPIVLQMISTIEGQLKADVNAVNAIKGAFPMGSMTGAPKVKSMQLIEQLESSKRGVYSGSIGYFSPDGQFDFNVVIRTLVYNASSQYLSIHVGSAITYDSNPAQEYEECLLKLKGWQTLLEE